jgi:hypothetical protein
MDVHRTLSAFSLHLYLLWAISAPQGFDLDTLYYSCCS